MAKSGLDGSLGSGLDGGLILGIESSCDETAAAVVERGRRTLSNVVASQMATHAPYGGVVPELASREHLRNIVPVVRAALEQARISFTDLDAIAVTEGPGLAGALLVGISYANALGYALEKPVIGVNHLEGHIHAVLLEQESALPLPALALVVSGGHTHLYLAERGKENPAQGWRYRNVGRTVDDAAGEAFDKVAKLLGLGYPGGPWIDFLAAHGDPNAVPFSFAQIKQKSPRKTANEAPGQSADGQGSDGTSSNYPDLNLPNRRLLFSFSGIKTAVLRYTETRNLRESIQARRTALLGVDQPRPEQALPLCDAETLGLIASFQRAVVDDLKRKTFLAAELYGVQSVIVSGGVAANRELRVRFTAEAASRGLPIAFPSIALSTDNAAMIAAAAWPKMESGEFERRGIAAEPSLALGR